LVEPFAGGASVALAALFEGRVERITLVELDPDVAAVWHTLLGQDARWLCDRIAGLSVSSSSVRAVLTSPAIKTRDRAFRTIVRNRVQRGGILSDTAGLMRMGENGRGLGSRWYPETLARRIMDINDRRHSIAFFQGDGILALRSVGRRSGLAVFIDPPYVTAGKRLYAYSEVDHSALFRAARNLKSPFLMSYDDVGEINRLAAESNLVVAPVAMRSAHHAEKSELLISRYLGWIPRERNAT